MASKKLRILLAEGHSAEVSGQLRALFRSPDAGLELTVVATFETLLPTIKVVDPEVILIDLGLTRPDPPDAIRRAHRASPGVPIIVFADPADKQYAAQCLLQGAMDYLLKGFIDPRTLDRVLRAALERNTLEGLVDLLREPATGLYTRDGLLTLGSHFQEEAEHTGGTLVLICVFFENLDTLRDGFGPGAADRALRDVAGILGDSCRRSDIVARIGPAQFALLGIDAAPCSAPMLVERVKAHLADHNRARSPWSPIELRLRVGTWAPQGNKPFAEFLDEIETELRWKSPSLIEEGLQETRERQLVRIR